MKNEAVTVFQRARAARHTTTTTTTTHATCCSVAKKPPNTTPTHVARLQLAVVASSPYRTIRNITNPRHKVNSRFGPTNHLGTCNENGGFKTSRRDPSVDASLGVCTLTRCHENHTGTGTGTGTGRAASQHDLNHQLLIVIGRTNSYLVVVSRRCRLGIRITRFP